VFGDSVSRDEGRTRDSRRKPQKLTP